LRLLSHQPGRTDAAATLSRLDAFERPFLYLFRCENGHSAQSIHPLSRPTLSALGSGLLDRALHEEKAGHVVNGLEEGAGVDANEEDAG
jgi:hypothetical protein